MPVIQNTPGLLREMDSHADVHVAAVGRVLGTEACRYRKPARSSQSPRCASLYRDAATARRQPSRGHPVRQAGRWL